MASTAADIIASAKAEAEAARQSALANLSGMGTDITNAYNTQQAATSAQYQNTLNQLQKAYQTNAKAAYANYMGEKQYLNNQLTRLGLQNTGYGVTQSLLSGSAYSKNLAGLQNALATNQANLGVQEQQALADLYSNYAKNKLSIDQYLYEAGQSAYDKAYANSYQAQQDAIANALQQQYYNYLYSTRSSGGNGGGGTPTEPSLTDENINLGQENSIKYDGKSGFGSLTDAVLYLKNNGVPNISTATDVKDLIAKGYLTTQTINGKLYYFPNLSVAKSANTKITTAAKSSNTATLSSNRIWGTR